MLEKIQSGAIDDLIETHHLLLKDELGKGENARHEKMYYMAINIAILLMRRSGHHDHNFSTMMEDKLRDHVNDIQNTYTSWKGRSLTILSGCLSIAGGLCGMAGAIPQFSKNTIESLGNVSKGFGGGAQGVGSFAKLFDENEASKRTLNQFSLEESKRRRDDRDQQRRQDEARIKESTRAMQEQNQAEHQAKQQMTGRQ